MYRYAPFKPPRNRVRRASGLVLTGDWENSKRTTKTVPLDPFPTLEFADVFGGDWNLITRMCAVH